MDELGGRVGHCLLAHLLIIHRNSVIYNILFKYSLHNLFSPLKFPFNQLPAKRKQFLRKSVSLNKKYKIIMED